MNDRDPLLVALPSIFTEARIIDKDEPWPARIAPLFDAIPDGCRACGGARFWRLRAGGPWTCGTCHAPLPAPERVEWNKGGRS